MRGTREKASQLEHTPNLRRNLHYQKRYVASMSDQGDPLSGLPISVVSRPFASQVSIQGSLGAPAIARYKKSYCRLGG